uniref:Uncharacterized protein n=1 Tax=Anguilla anguilla TaxID=7936 RepID=A0A0E9VLU3_ANGAN
MASSMINFSIPLPFWCCPARWGDITNYRAALGG